MTDPEIRAEVRALLCQTLCCDDAELHDDTLLADHGLSSIDLLDVVAHAAAGDTPDADLAEVFLSCLFAVAGSIGFLLGWSIYLVGTTEPAHPSWVVREALRLWPVAWQFGRTPSREHQLAAVTAKPTDEVVVCSYLVHRDPAHWSEPDEFRPGRWATGAGQEAFIPFGWGPHACTGAGVRLFDGRNDRRSATRWSASSSSTAVSDATPLRRSWTWAPPSEECVVATPVKPRTAAGPLT